jgi:homospermidine synthase
LTDDHVVNGIDELGVLLFGHAENDWYGSTSLDRGDATARVPPERDRAAGDLGRLGRHRLDVGESG